MQERQVLGVSSCTGGTRTHRYPAAPDVQDHAQRLRLAVAVDHEDRPVVVGVTGPTP